MERRRVLKRIAGVLAGGAAVAALPKVALPEPEPKVVVKTYWRPSQVEAMQKIYLKRLAESGDQRGVMEALKEAKWLYY